MPHNYFYILSRRLDNQQGPTVKHMELYSMLWGSMDGRGVWGRIDTCVCMAESLHWSPETITTLLIGSTPIQNYTFKKKEIEPLIFSRTRDYQE